MNLDNLVFNLMVLIISSQLRLLGYKDCLVDSCLLISTSVVSNNILRCHALHLLVVSSFSNSVNLSLLLLVVLVLLRWEGLLDVVGLDPVLTLANDLLGRTILLLSEEDLALEVSFLILLYGVNSGKVV